MRILADRALAHVLAQEDVETVLDVGSGPGLHAQAFRDAGKTVTTVNLYAPADYVGSYPKVGPHFSRPYDCVWASHVLEHQRNPGEFLDACVAQTKHGGLLAFTVPPEKPELVGGHLTTWTTGRLLYHLVLAGLDCSTAWVAAYGYNLSVVVRKALIAVPTDLAMDAGDLEVLARWFPTPVAQNCDGRTVGLTGTRGA